MTRLSTHRSGGRRWRLLGRGVVLAVIGCVLLALSGIQAQAAPSTASDCPSQTFCFWMNANFSGAGPGEIQGNNSDWRAFPQGSCRTGTWNDCASSAVNNTTKAFILFENIDHRGGAFCILPGNSVANFANFKFDNGDDLNDAVSSNEAVIIKPPTIPKPC